jgi:4-amino-4-deoxychorismate lyase
MILVNGVENAGLPATDRGLAYGDGIFRTFVGTAGLPRQWPQHYAKLASDCAVIGIACPDAELLGKEVWRVCHATGDCAIKVIVSRGAGGRGYRYTGDGAPTRVVMSTPLPGYPPAYHEAGVRVRLCALRLAHQPALAGLKHLNRLENVLARAEWSDAGVAEGLLRDTEDNVIGGTMTNIFIARRGALATPRLDRCGVAGVTRDRVMQLAGQNGVACEVTSVAWSDVLGADEIVLVNSLAGAWPVCDIEGEKRTPGPLARAIQSWLKRDDAQMA